jgi:lysophospholipase L1-like esterase
LIANSIFYWQLNKTHLAMHLFGVSAMCAMHLFYIRLLIEVFMKNKIVFVLLVIMSLSFAMPQEKKITLWLIGDSTMSIKETKAYPETGWGMPFVYFWNNSVTVDNRAKNGRSTKTFISENRWQPVADSMQAGDYVFIQFGHNDEAKDKKDRYTTPEAYKANLIKYIADTKAKNATPILLTPVSRRKFDTAGKALETHVEYSALVRQVATEQKVILIDLDVKSQALYQQFGVENSKLLFMQLKASENPNYPDGRDDNTHFNELGARLIAQIVLSEIKNKLPELAERIVVGLKK